MSCSYWASGWYLAGHIKGNSYKQIHQEAGGRAYEMLHEQQQSQYSRRGRAKELLEHHQTWFEVILSSLLMKTCSSLGRQGSCFIFTWSYTIVLHVSETQMWTANLSCRLQKNCTGLYERRWLDRFCFYFSLCIWTPSEEICNVVIMGLLVPSVDWINQSQINLLVSSDWHTGANGGAGGGGLWSMEIIHII